jgi:hypothetical protein
MKSIPTPTDVQYTAQHHPETNSYEVCVQGRIYEYYTIRAESIDEVKEKVQDLSFTESMEPHETFVDHYDAAAKVEIWEQRGDDYNVAEVPTLGY